MKRKEGRKEEGRNKKQDVKNNEKDLEAGIKCKLKSFENSESEEGEIIFDRVGRIKFMQKPR